MLGGQTAGMSETADTPPAPVPPEAAPEGYIDIEYVVEPNYAGWRLERYLGEKIRRLPRARILGIIQRGLLCEHRLTPSTLVYPGLVFRIRRQVSDEPETPTEQVPTEPG